jgi:hypothetical protein
MVLTPFNFFYILYILFKEKYLKKPRNGHKGHKILCKMYEKFENCV